MYRQNQGRDGMLLFLAKSTFLHGTGCAGIELPPSRRYSNCGELGFDRSDANAVLEDQHLEIRTVSWLRLWSEYLQVDNSFPTIVEFNHSYLSLALDEMVAAMSMCLERDVLALLQHQSE
ncbi:hypothetical protein Tco_0278476 [Tanacetum coccineum]